jgi:hypothetical protein
MGKEGGEQWGRPGERKYGSWASSRGGHRQSRGIAVECVGAQNKSGAAGNKPMFLVWLVEAFGFGLKEV